MIDHVPQYFPIKLRLLNQRVSFHLVSPLSILSSFG